ncbi:hypothetical protein R3I94_015232 [Phoxinus phoxinus]|uniref:Uncharacterized protein n=1 Tax=Phoxinus phoxinus TaxID=58324 RepID=A0AAN9CUT9_9TELE
MTDDHPLSTSRWSSSEAICGGVFRFFTSVGEFKENNNKPHPVPSRKRLGTLTHPKPAAKPSTSLNIRTISAAPESYPAPEPAPGFSHESVPVREIPQSQVFSSP